MGWLSTIWHNITHAHLIASKDFVTFEICMRRLGARQITCAVVPSDGRLPVHCTVGTSTFKQMVGCSSFNEIMTVLYESYQ